MIRYLLDVNVLIALLDPAHVQHDRAHEWFASTGSQAWATCPLTENGVLRIVGNARYPNSPGTPAAVAEMMISLKASPAYEFGPDSISLLHEQHVHAARLSDAAQVTDTYLLALARAHRGRLATFDRHLVTNAVLGGPDTLHLIR